MTTPASPADAPEIRDGRVTRWGQFARPPAGLDPAAARWPVNGATLPAPLRRLRLKQWQHIGLVHPSAWIGFVVFDAGFLGVSFFTAAPWEEPELHLDIERRGAPWRARVAENIHAGQCEARWPGYVLRIHNDLRHARHRVDASIDGPRPVRIDLTLHQRFSEVDPLVVLHDLGSGQPFYTHKAPLAPEGMVQVGDRVYTFDPVRDTALLDEQKTAYPLKWWWRWATFAGTTTCGRRVVVNACHNVLPDDEHHNENAVWVDGRLHRVGAVRFTFDADDPVRPWHIRSTDGRLKLVFRPLGERVGDQRVGPLGARFRQPWGTFAGTVPDAGDGTMTLADGRGVCEQQDVIG
ncbi:MAG: DUF2804 domain-containing protein [Deltaproteobacteria bacterium]|nr:MAG: DUF2804 domain-containing protein [Deltaproteobacteria bacterium]